VAQASLAFVITLQPSTAASQLDKAEVLSALSVNAFLCKMASAEVIVELMWEASAKTRVRSFRLQSLADIQVPGFALTWTAPEASMSITSTGIHFPWLDEKNSREQSCCVGLPSCPDIA
jgi:hypothetical protein